MTDQIFPTPIEFLLKESLYEDREFSGELIWKVIATLYFGGTYDNYCVKCKRDSTFQAIQKEQPATFARNANREALITRNGGTPEYPLIPSDIYRVSANCTRTKEHLQDFIFFVDHLYRKNEEDKWVKVSVVKKVGQQPSFSDLNLVKVKKYAPVLTKAQLRELNRAIGLASHDVGIGAYVYLRRVFEALVEESHVQASNDAGWDEEKYNTSRMAERIGLLKGHLPNFLSQNAAMYSLLSKGVHELSEEECLKHFDTLRIGIELILDEKLERKTRELKINEAQEALAKANISVNK